MDNQIAIPKDPRDPKVLHLLEKFGPPTPTGKITGIARRHVFGERTLASFRSIVPDINAWVSNAKYVRRPFIVGLIGLPQPAVKKEEVMSNASVVWKNQVDKKFDVQVARTEPYKGVLTVKDEKGVLIKQELVTISYDAKMGVDCSDEAEWCDMAVKAVDEHLAKQTEDKKEQ